MKKLLLLLKSTFNYETIYFLMSKIKCMFITMCVKMQTFDLELSGNGCKIMLHFYIQILNKFC